MRILTPLAVGLLLAACSQQKPTGFTVFVAGDTQPAIQSFFEFLPEANAHVVASANAASDVQAGHGSGVRVALLKDLDCGECYRLTGSNWSYQVHAGGTLGMQYGLAELLESFNFRFLHPWGVKAPATFASPDKSSAFGPTFKPQMSLRGLHLHTLHPIEGYYAFWEPGDQQLQDARRITDWTVKNRGNYIEWAALENILASGHDEWHSHTKAIIDDAHQRGVKTGIAVELFGNSNLQLAYVLLDTDKDADPQTTIDQRLHALLDGLAWDNINLSFGEFTGSDPDVFVKTVDLVYQELQKIAPGMTMTATVHVGNSPALTVTYQGQQLPYYFLVQFCNPAITPWIHSVMYYDFFQDAGGAYGYDMFTQHLGYLQDQLKAGKPVAYYPESAYWVAFDNSVPTYLPVYMRSRWLDMHQLQSASMQGGYAQLDQHVLFSTGWEWGYWQNDYATLRMNFGIPDSWDAPVQEMFSPWGTQGQQLAAQIHALGELQSQALIDERLAAYIAARDKLMDFGAGRNIVSQPARTSFDDVKAMDAAAREKFAQSVLMPLADLQAKTEQIQTAVNAIGLDPQDPWLSETVDGIAVDVARTRFIHALYEGVAAYAADGNDAGWMAKADAALADAQTIISRRHSHLHYPNGSHLTEDSGNDTLYQYGYLKEADNLCYWQRERIQARAIVYGEMQADPGCVL